MAYKRLFVFVEGFDDVKFFEAVLKPHFDNKYDSLQIIKYAGMKIDKRINFLSGIKAMEADYIYVADINSEPCVTNKKAKVKEQLGNSVEQKRMAVAIKEIESWYLAGLTVSRSKNMGIRALGRTDDVTKEKFNQLIPKKYNSRVDFMAELLKRFSVPIAMKKNKSFQYFRRKFVD